jgi:hypothetical protein
LPTLSYVQRTYGSLVRGQLVDNVVGVSAEHNVGGGVVGSLGRVRAGFTPRNA